MRKASKILYLVSGILGIIGIVLWAILGIVGIVGSLAAAAEATGDDAALVAAAGIVGGVFMLIGAAICVLVTVISFLARSGKASNIVALVFGIIGCVSYGFGVPLLIGAILGIVADKQGQPE